MRDTYVNSYSDPDFIGKEYNKVIVFADLSNNLENQFLEDEISKYLQEEMVLSGSYLRLFPPTRNWTEDKIAKQLKKMKYDGFIQISIDNIITKEKVIPAQTITTVKKVEEKIVKNKKSNNSSDGSNDKENDRNTDRRDDDKDKKDNSRSSSVKNSKSKEKKYTTSVVNTEHIPETYKTESLINFRVNLIDLKTNKIAWTGFAKRKFIGDQYSDEFQYSKLRYLAQDIISQLKKDKHIYQPE